MTTQAASHRPASPERSAAAPKVVAFRGSASTRRPGTAANHGPSHPGAASHPPSVSAAATLPMSSRTRFRLRGRPRSTAKGATSASCGFAKSGVIASPARPCPRRAAVAANATHPTSRKVHCPITKEVIAGCEPNRANPASVCATGACGRAARSRARTPSAAVTIPSTAQIAAAGSSGSSASGSSASATCGGYP